MKNKIIVAGNIIVDRLYPIAGYPERGQLTKILDGIGQSVGGAVCNVGIDLKRLMPDTEVCALGLVGPDEGGDFALKTMADAGMDVSLVNRDGVTSFTAVMSDAVTHERTFFTYGGANARFSEDSFYFGYYTMIATAQKRQLFSGLALDGGQNERRND